MSINTIIKYIKSPSKKKIGIVLIMPASLIVIVSILLSIITSSLSWKLTIMSIFALMISAYGLILLIKNDDMNKKKVLGIILVSPSFLITMFPFILNIYIFATQGIWEFVALLSIFVAMTTYGMILLIKK